MSAPAQQLETSNLIEVDQAFHVGIRKYGLDTGTPWFRLWFFRFVFLPFNRFAFRRMKIPALDQAELEQLKCKRCKSEVYVDKVTFSWFEHVAIATEKSIADKMCKGDFWPVTPLPVNTPYPEKSLRASGQTHPASKTPNRYQKTVFPYTAVKIVTLEKLKHQVEILKNAVGL